MASMPCPWEGCVKDSAWHVGGRWIVQPRFAFVQHLSKIFKIDFYDFHANTVSRCWQNSRQTGYNSREANAYVSSAAAGPSASKQWIELVGDAL